MKTIFDLCRPRADVAEGRVRDEEFAADLAAVIAGKAPKEYGDAATFFRHTHPTRGLKHLLETVCKRLSGTGGELNSVIRLDTQFGGGKTHGLIALVHAVRGMPGVASPEEFVAREILPAGPVRVAALDGENSDPTNGVRLEKGLLARTMWGEMAYRLAGRAGFDRLRASDESGVAPGVDTITELFGGEPTLILIDEIAVYLRKVARASPASAQQFPAFLQALLKAVAATPRVALVFTLAVRADDQTATDAYKVEQQSALAAFEEAESVASRKATQLNPTEEDETGDVLRRRLFDSIDAAGAKAVVAAYTAHWDRNKDALPAEAFSAETRDQFRRGYPLHPETLNTLVEKTSSLSTFQRTRGMLRLLARTVHHLWKTRPADALAIHPHHIDPGFQAIRDEITTRLGQGAYMSALAADVAAVPGKPAATAQEIDAAEYPGQPPVTSYVARTIFLHTLAFGDGAQGISPDRLRYSVTSPAIEPSFVEAARKRFIAGALYLDDRPAAEHRFLTEPNLTQMIRKAAAEADPGDVRAYLDERIRDLFGGKGQSFWPVPFPASPHEIDDDIRDDGRPYLAILHYEALAVSETPTSLPNELVRLATKAGVNETNRIYRNNLVFVAADARNVEDMQQAVRRRIALSKLREPERLRDLAEHQQRKVNEEFDRSRFKIAQAILQAYRHLFYPSAHSLGGGDARLGHTAIEIPDVSDSPGEGQSYLKRALREQKKLLETSDAPDAPGYVRDQTPLKTKGEITTRELRDEFRKAPKLSILLSDDPLLACIRKGIEDDLFVYREGSILAGKGDPSPTIKISENAFVHTVASAKAKGLWPRPAVVAKEKEEKRKTGGGAGGSGPDSGSGGGSGGGDGQAQAPGTGPAAAPALSAEGPLNQALTVLFEKARKQDVKSLREVKLRLFEAAATWNVHQAVAVYKDARATCEFTTTLAAEGIDHFKLEFRGAIAKANAVKSFLDPQLRAAEDKEFEGSYTLAFDPPLATAPEKAELFVKAMTKYGGGEAFVEATAAVEAKVPA